MEITSRIKELRKKVGLTQEELAGKIGVTRATVISWEKGATSPDGKELQTLSKIFDEDLTNITSVSEKKQPDSEEIRLLIKAIDRIGSTNDYLLNRVRELEDQLRSRK